MLLASLLALVPALDAAAQPAAPPPGDPMTTTAVAERSASGRPSGLMAGVEVGQPTSLTVGWLGLDGLLGVAAALGTGTWSGTGLSVRGDVLVTPAAIRLGAMHLLTHVGVGVRYRRHHYDPASVDEIPDEHTGIRGSLAVGLAPSPQLELYLEVAPGYDFARTDSCTLLSGINSFCPHAQSSRGFLDAVIGARWFFGVL